MKYIENIPVDAVSVMTKDNIQLRSRSATTGKPLGEKSDSLFRNSMLSSGDDIEAQHDHVDSTPIDKNFLAIEADYADIFKRQKTKKKVKKGKSKKKVKKRP